MTMTLRPITYLNTRLHFLRRLQFRTNKRQKRLTNEYLLCPFFKRGLLSIPISFLRRRLSRLNGIFHFRMRPPTSNVSTLQTFLPPNISSTGQTRRAKVRVVRRFLTHRFLCSNQRRMNSRTIMNMRNAKLILRKRNGRLLRPVNIHLFTCHSNKINIIPTIRNRRITCNRNYRVFTSNYQGLIKRRKSSLIHRLRPTFKNNGSRNNNNRYLTSKIRSIELVLFPFTRPFFNGSVTILRGRSAIRILSNFLCNVRVSIRNLIRLQDDNNTKRTLNRLISKGRLCTFILGNFPSTKTYRRINRSLTIRHRILVSSIRSNFRFVIIRYQIIWRGMTLTQLRLLRYFSRTDLLFFNNSFKTIMPSMNGPMILKKIRTISKQRIMFFNRPLRRLIRFLTRANKRRISKRVTRLQGTFRHHLCLYTRLLLCLLSIPFLLRSKLSQVNKIERRRQMRVTILIHRTKTINRQAPLRILPLTNSSRIRTSIRSQVFFRRLSNF